MPKLTREKALAAIRAAGASDDHQAFVRLYAENRVSLKIARKHFAQGQQIRRFVEKRDAERTTP